MNIEIQTPSSTTASLPRLTKQEVIIFQQVFDGKPAREIAEQLFLSKRTVEFHLANIYAKLNVSNRTQAIRVGLRVGLLTL